MGNGGSSRLVTIAIMANCGGIFVIKVVAVVV
jgi:hypothetical protein